MKTINKNNANLNQGGNMQNKYYNPDGSITTNHGSHKATTIFKISKNPKIYQMTYSVVKNHEIINRIQVTGKTIKEVKSNYDLAATLKKENKMDDLKRATIEQVSMKCEELIGNKVARIDELNEKMEKINDPRNWGNNDSLRLRNVRKAIKILEKEIAEIEEIYAIAEGE